MAVLYGSGSGHQLYAADVRNIGIRLTPQRSVIATIEVAIEFINWWWRYTRLKISSVDHGCSRMGPFSKASKPMSFEVSLYTMPSSSSVECGVLGGCVCGHGAVAAKKSVPVKSAVKSSGKKRSTLFLSELPIIVGYFTLWLWAPGLWYGHVGTVNSK
jgi:hypothetical protein